MKIALVMATLPSSRRASEGGVTYVIHWLANALVRHGQDVTVFSLDQAPEDALYSWRLIPGPPWLGNKKLARYYLLAYYVARIDFQAFDVLHTNGEDWLLGSKKAQPPRVRTYWGSALGEAFSSTRARRFISQAFVQYPLEYVSALTAVRRVGISRMTARQLPVVQDIIPPGVDLETFRPGGMKSPRPSILFVASRLGGRKRGDVLVKAFERVVRPALPEAELWLRCADKVEGAGLRWLPPVPTNQVGELAERYRQAWAFCLPSSYEGFGVPYVEALACGTPVVATVNGGAEEILDNGRYGLMTSIQRLGQTLLALLTDSGRRQKLADAGLERAREYSWERVAERYVQVYREARAARAA